MLVITRRPLFRDNTPMPAAALAVALACTGHSVWIGPNIRVRVMRIADGAVKLGIEAPLDVIVRRDELEEAP